MKHLISIGGGFSSTIELPLAVIDKYGAENVDMVIACLAGESPDLWRLVSECEQRTGKEVTRISYYPNDVRAYLVNAPESKWWGIWDVFFKEGRMGSSLADPCSRVLKRETLSAYILRNYSPSDTVLHVGITAHEIDRMMAIRRNWGKLGYPVEADLADLPTKGTTAERCKAVLGWVPRLYEWGASHNNCGGFCVKAGHAQMARLLWHDPELYAYHEQQEIRFQQKFKTDATIMRDRVTLDSVTTSTPLSMRAFRERMQQRWAGMMFPPFDELDQTPACSFCESVA
jgi:hypothetical protein